MDEKLLTEKLRGGDQDALGKIYKLESTKCISIAYGVLWPDYDEAQDVVQYSFVKLWENRESIKINQGYKSWLYRTTKNRALDIVKVHKNRLRILREQHGNKSETSVNEDVLAVKEEVAKLLDQLSEKHRSVVFYRYWGQFSVEEIAEILDIPAGTVRSRLFDAQQKMKQCL